MTRFAVVSKTAASGFEVRDIQLPVLLALDSVSEKTRMVSGEFVSAVVPQRGQCYDMIREEMRDILYCPRGCCELEGREVSARSGCDCFGIRCACTTLVLLVDVGFCEGLAVS